MVRSLASLFKEVTVFKVRIARTETSKNRKQERVKKRDRSKKGPPKGPSVTP